MFVLPVLLFQRLPHDFQGQPKSLAQRSSMKMEDYKRMLHVFLPLVLAGPPGSAPLIHPTLIKALGRVRRFAENHTQPHGDESEEDRLARIEKFEVEIHEYAKEAVRVSLCTLVRPMFANIGFSTYLCERSTGAQYTCPSLSSQLSTSHTLLIQTMWSACASSQS